jgi:tRNA dimethylallyltransferase
LVGADAPDWHREANAGLIAVVGPTASGKTELAIRIAEILDGEIVSADSVQVYRGFDVGSGKPTPNEVARAHHHMIDVFDPLEHVDAARYAALARRAMDDILARGKVPVVCGGTFLWVKALLYGLAEAPGADPAIRTRLLKEAETGGRAALHARLAAVDPASAARLHPNDFVRVSRALEVFELTGTSLTAWQEAHAFSEDPHRARLFAVARTAEDLTRRIEARVQAWLAQGWIGEVQGLLVQGFADARAMSSVGYREVKAHLQGELPRESLARAIVRATRIFARRQRTWLNHTTVRWVGPDGRFAQPPSSGSPGS